MLNTDLSFVAIVITECVAFYKFYSGNYGRCTIYSTWYAWIIDFMSILSGGMIMLVAIS